MLGKETPLSQSLSKCDEMNTPSHIEIHLCCHVGSDAIIIPFSEGSRRVFYLQSTR